MNTRLFNLAASGHKHRRTAPTLYRDKAPIEEDFGTIRWREETVSSRGQVQTTKQRESLYSDKTWSTGESWLPEDSTEFGLEEEEVWFDNDDNGICNEIQLPLPIPGGQNKRSIVSVSHLFQQR